MRKLYSGAKFYFLESIFINWTIQKNAHYFQITSSTLLLTILIMTYFNILLKKNSPRHT